MELLRKLRWVLYPNVAIFVLLFSAYCSFPDEVVRKFVDTAIFNTALMVGPKDRGAPTITMADVGLWRGSGVKVEDLKIIWAPSPTKQMPLSLNIDSLKGRIGFLSLVSATKNISGQMDLYGGSMDAAVKIRKSGELASLDMNLSKLDLSKIDFIEGALGAPFKGILEIKTDITANSQFHKDGNGILRLSLDKGVFGPGNVNLPAGGFVSSIAVPQLNLGKLLVDFAVDKGLITSKSLTLNGGDLEGQMQLTITMAKMMPLSRLDGSGWFSLKKEFINANETVKMLFDLIPELRAAQQGDGKVQFSLRGMIGRPQFKLESNGGPSASNKAKAALRDFDDGDEDEIE